MGFLEQRYESRGGFAACRQVYNIPHTLQSYGSLLGYDFATVALLSAAVVEDDTELLGVIAERYFAVAASAVRRHDPGGLVFGQRFVGQDIVPAVLAAAGRHFDVISVQPSPFSFDDDQEAAASAAELARISALAGGRPVFVADQTTHFDGVFGGLRASCFVDDAGRLHGCAANATGAGMLYAQYLAELRQRPEIIGYSHCQYVNRAVCPGSADAKRAAECRGGPAATNLHLKQGMLNFDGSPQAEYVSLVAAANKKYGLL